MKDFPSSGPKKNIHTFIHTSDSDQSTGDGNIRKKSVVISTRSDLPSTNSKEIPMQYWKKRHSVTIDMSASSYRAENVIPARQTQRMGCQEIWPRRLCRVHLENTRTTRPGRRTTWCDITQLKWAVRAMHPCPWEDTQKNKRKRIGTRTQESCSETPSSKARGNAGKLCVPMSIETHGACPIA